MLIDVHAHFYHAASPRADWRERNASRLAAGRKIGVTIHVASILGSWGRTSPIYFPSPRDVEDGNTALLALQREYPNLIRGYVTVNPNYRMGRSSPPWPRDIPGCDSFWRTSAGAATGNTRSPCCAL